MFKKSRFNNGPLRSITKNHVGGILCFFHWIPKTLSIVCIKVTLAGLKTWSWWSSHTSIYEILNFVVGVVVVFFLGSFPPPSLPFPPQLITLYCRHKMQYVWMAIKRHPHYCHVINSKFPIHSRLFGFNSFIVSWKRRIAWEMPS